MTNILYRKPPNAEATLVKIVIPLEGGNSWHHFKAETLWAEDLTGGSYRIRNVPFAAYEISNEDVVEAVSKDGRLTVTGVIARGGHSTYRIILTPEVGSQSEVFQEFWGRLQALGCSHESYEGRVFAVDVSPAANIYDVYYQLEDGEKNGVWDFEEGHCGHALAQ